MLKKSTQLITYFNKRFCVKTTINQLTKEKLLLYLESVQTKDFFSDFTNIKENYYEPVLILNLLKNDTGFTESSIEKCTDILLNKQLYGIVDIKHLQDLLKIQSLHQTFPNIKQIKHILNKILSNIEINKALFLTQENLCNLVEILKDLILIQPKITKYTVFHVIVEKILTLENFRLLEDQYLVFALFILNTNYLDSANQIPSLKTVKLKFFIEYSLTNQSIINKIAMFGKDLFFGLNDKKNIAKKLFLIISSFDDSIVPIQTSLTEREIPLLIISFYKDLKQNFYSQKFRFLLNLTENYLKILEKDLEDEKRLDFVSKDKVEIHMRIEVLKALLEFISQKNIYPEIKTVIDILISFFREYQENLNLNHLIRLYCIFSTKKFMINYDLSIIVPSFKESLKKEINNFRLETQEQEKFVIENFNHLLLVFFKLKFFDMEIVQLIFEKIAICRNIYSEEEEEIKIISFLLHFLIVNNTNLLNDVDIVRFLQSVQSCLGQIDKRIEKFLDDNELPFSRKIELVLIYLKYFYSYEKKNINSTIKNCVLDWIKDNNDEMKIILSISSSKDDDIKFEKMPPNDLLAITRLFNIYLMLKLISTRLYHDAFKDNYVPDFINSHYKELLKYFLDKEPEVLDTPDKNNTIQLLERNSSLLGFLLKKNSYDIREFTKETHENFDLQYLIN